MLLTINHETRYTFDQAVIYGMQRLRLRPKSTHGQQVMEWETALVGARHEAAYEDQHHNHVELVSLEPGVSEVVITCRGNVRTADNHGILGEHAGHFPLWAFTRATPLTRSGPRVRALAASAASYKEERLAMLHRLSLAVREAVEYEPGATDVTTTAEQSLAAGHGVCQDHAHIFISAARLLEVPARYVGGYLKMDGRVEQDAGHGWAEAHVPGLGWIGFDVSNSISPDERYVRVTTGCDYAEAAPVAGVVTGAGKGHLSVHLSVDAHEVGQQQQQQSAS